MKFHAHSGTPDDKSDWQGLQAHSLAVAQGTAKNLKPAGLEAVGFLVGLLHDLGKYNPAFQPILEGANARVDHSTAGAAILLDRMTANPFERAKVLDQVTAELGAYCIMGHHAGLPDMETEHSSCFVRRREGFVENLAPIWEAELAPVFTGITPPWLADLYLSGGPHQAFDISVVTRMLFSALVDADFKDTEAHYQALEGREPDRKWASLSELLPRFQRDFDAHMAKFRADGELNALRRHVLDHVRGKAAMPPGLFTLTVPTGGGKTLASLGFALDHAAAHGMRRIIYAIPFTSIVDQSADVFRSVLGHDHVLEHHSAIDEERSDRGRKPTTRDRMKLAMEDWAAPVVVTTNVQFFESLFAARTSRARKLHNIAGSIIILDEAQTIPRPLLMPCIRMLDTLARLFGCTIVLCTATQPALGRPEAEGEPGFKHGLDLAGRELAPDPEGLFRKLKRAHAVQAGPMDNPAVIAALRAEPQALVIVNSRKHALELYKEAVAGGLDGLVHLTTRQCAAHRRKILADVRKRLGPDAPQPCRVIATSLIEAGVDIDFPKAWRAKAGLDSIIQAAGRVNREGRRRWQDSPLTVFEAPDYPPPPEIKGLVEAMGRIMSSHKDLMSLAAIEKFFGEVYWQTGSGLDAKDILDAIVFHRGKTNFAFRQVADKFRMIENTMLPVIILWDEVAEKAVQELSVKEIPSGVIARRLQTYVVQVPRKARDLLVKHGHVSFEREDLRADQFAVLRTKSLYTEEFGLLWEDSDYLAAENSII